MPPWDRVPVRGEIFGAERLEQHARSLAAAQPVSKGRIRDDRLAGRLADNATFLLQANRALAKSTEDGHHDTPAAEWLADNYHLVDMQIREIGIDLPPGFYAQLQKLATGPFTGLPRVFGAMWSLVAHTDSHIDLEALRRYLVAYQTVQPFTIGELWAVPITLRIVLIENLRRVDAQGVMLEAMILKPNMVLPGRDCPTQDGIEAVAGSTLACLQRSVPAAVAGIAFLSGGQSAELASARLNAINIGHGSTAERAPWPLVFSFGRALQQPALQIWRGLDANVLAAQRALIQRATLNGAALHGAYAASMEDEPALRMAS